MDEQKIRKLLQIAEEALRQAQAVFTDENTEEPHEGTAKKLTDPQRRARLLAHFVAAKDNSLSRAQVSHAAKVSGYGDPRGVAALYNGQTNWLKSQGDERIMTPPAVEWFESKGKQHLDGYKAVNI